MKKARNERFNKLRYLYFIGIIALGLNTSLGPASSEGLEEAESEKLGELRYFTLDSEEVGVSYSIGIATPLEYDESGAPYPAVFALDGAYYLENNRLPVVLYAAGATEHNAKFVRPFMQNLMSRGYQKLIAKYEEFQGSHDGILAEALPSGFDWLDSQIDELTPFPAEILYTWSNGIWYWDVAESEWTKMTASNPTGDIAAGDFTGDGKADVASCWDNGLWYQDGATLGWTKISDSAPVSVAAGHVTGN